MPTCVAQADCAEACAEKGGVGSSRAYLTSALCYADHTMALLCKQLLQVGHEAMVPVHGKVHLWNQAYIHDTC